MTAICTALEPVGIRLGDGDAFGVRQKPRLPPQRLFASAHRLGFKRAGDLLPSFDALEVAFRL
jgi:hypothetical protein